MTENTSNPTPAPEELNDAELDAVAGGTDGSLLDYAFAGAVLVGQVAATIVETHVDILTGGGGTE